jgi:hypothetical protein
MSTPSELGSKARTYTGEVWRIAEDQAFSATARVTASNENQARLEELLDATKPPWPADTAGYDFLISTPFRYSPYPNGSRFRRANQPAGVYYASEDVRTAIAEMAFYRLLFFLSSPSAARPRTPVAYTAFTVKVETDKLIDLTLRPLDRRRDEWTNPTNYNACQELADRARAAGIEAIRYESVRDPSHSANLAILKITAITTRRPGKRQTWHIFVRDDRVQARRESPRDTIEFPIVIWANDARLNSVPPSVP